MACEREGAVDVDVALVLRDMLVVLVLNKNVVAKPWRAD